jgi:hypothetical protein
MLEAQLSIAEGCSSVHGGFVRATERKNGFLRKINRKGEESS